MRRWLWLLLMLLALPASGQVVFPPIPFRMDPANPAMNRLQAWYLVLPHLRGGTHWYDLVGRYTGTLTNMDSTAGFQAPAKPGWYGAVVLDGTDDYVDIGDLAAFDFADTTFTVVFEVENATDTGATAYWIAKRDLAIGGGYFIRTSTSGVITARVVEVGTLSAGERSSVTANLYDGLRHHVAIVFTTDTVTLANNDVSIYVDGLLDQGSRTDSGAGAYATCACPLTFGTQSNHTSPARGSINNVRFYARGLSAMEIAQLAAQAKTSDPAAAFFSDEEAMAPPIVMRRAPQVYQ